MKRWEITTPVAIALAIVGGAAFIFALFYIPILIACTQGSCL